MNYYIRCKHCKCHVAHICRSTWGSVQQRMVSYLTKEDLIKRINVLQKHELLVDSNGKEVALHWLVTQIKKSDYEQVSLW